TKNSEVLGRNADNRDVADKNRLHVSLSLLPLLRSECLSHVGEDAADGLRSGRNVLRCVPCDLGIFLGVIEPANPKLHVAADRRQSIDLPLARILAGILNDALEATDGIGD